MAKYYCWIDHRRCHSPNPMANVESCKLCQDSKLKHECIKKGMNPFKP